MRYLKSFNENMGKSKSIFNKKMEEYNKLKELLEKNLGYIGQFTELLFNGTPYEEIERLYNRLLELKGRNIKIDIDGLSSEKIEDTIQTLLEDSDIKRLINKFPKEQKDLIKKNSRPSSFRTLLIKLTKKEDISKFISKISRYKDEESLHTAIKIFSKDVNNDKDVVIKTVNSLPNSSIVYDNNNKIVVEVDKYDDIKVLGSDTSWCIVNSKHQWNNYTKGNKTQYILYDWDLEYEDRFKIGITYDNVEGMVSDSHTMSDRACVSYSNKIIKDNNINLQKEFTDELLNELPPYLTSSKLKVGDIKKYIKDGECNLSNFDIINLIVIIYNKKMAESTIRDSIRDLLSFIIKRRKNNYRWLDLNDIYNNVSSFKDISDIMDYQWKTKKNYKKGEDRIMNSVMDSIRRNFTLDINLGSIINKELITNIDDVKRGIEHNYYNMVKRFERYHFRKINEIEKDEKRSSIVADFLSRSIKDMINGDDNIDFDIKKRLSHLSNILNLLRSIYYNPPTTLDKYFDINMEIPEKFLEFKIGLEEIASKVNSMNNK